MRGRYLFGAVAASALALAGCGGDDSATPEATDTVVTTTAPAETTMETQTTTSVETDTASVETTPQPTTVTIRVVGGVPQGGIARPRVKEGERVVLVIHADAGESVHVHGYDVERAIVPGKPARLPFTATIPGRFEVELHHPDAVLAVVEVRP
jgi:hypothetical protein